MWDYLSIIFLFSHFKTNIIIKPFILLNIPSRGWQSGQMRWTQEVLSDELLRWLLNASHSSIIVKSISLVDTRVRKQWSSVFCCRLSLSPHFFFLSFVLCFIILRNALRFKDCETFVSLSWGTLCVSKVVKLLFHYLKECVTFRG